GSFGGVCWFRAFGGGDGVFPFFDYGADLFGGVEARFDVLEAVPGQHAEQIGGNEDLSVAVRSGADPDGGDRNGAGEFSGQGWGEQFEDDGESAGVDQSVGVGEEGVALGLLFAFDVVAAFFEHVLRQHAQMAKKRNAAGQDGLYLGQDAAAAFGFNG